MPLGWIPAGEQTLNGDQALWYGRSREYVDDYARIQRQQCVQQAMLKQLDPATLLAKFEDIAKAGTKVVDSNISSSQLGSFVDLAMKAKGQEVKRLTIGPPDFDASFSTVPDFDQIHDRVDQLLASASGAQSAGTADDVMAVPAAGGGHVQASGSRSPGVLQAGGSTAQQATPAPSDFTPVTTTPDGEPITAEMLNQLKSEGNEQAIRDLVANERPVRAALARCPHVLTAQPKKRNGLCTKLTTSSGTTRGVRPQPSPPCWAGRNPVAPRPNSGSAPTLTPRPPPVSRQDRSTTPLDELIAADPAHLLGAESVARFGPRLPFLAKILAAAQPLSLQVHPSLRAGAGGFARENADGVPAGRRRTATTATTTTNRK